ncbi:MAG: radical SAM family heme chaperone HemW [Bacteroidales bacterium]|nr:radical SAM family heme chaperone HemW [Candidatus Cacconaster scatequi]
MAGIYVHFPFCTSRCIYCDFYSRVRKDFPEYVDALIREAEDRRGFLKGVPPATLYFGGGTPSVLPVGELERLVSALSGSLDLSGVGEFTVEVNPDDIDFDKAYGFRTLGVTRISMGIQSMNDDHLKWMKRRHTAEDAVRAFKTLRGAGFGNISVDLIFGYEGLSSQEWGRTIRKVVELFPEHISCYQMMGKYASADDDACLSQYLALQSVMGEAGYQQYEISNYCKPGFHSRHNSAYWRREPYLGLGAAAHSFDGGYSRYWNVSDTDAYIAGAPLRGENLTDVEVAEEVIMLGLRTSDGIPKELVCRNPSYPGFIASGAIIESGDRVRISPASFFVSDDLISRLISHI